MVNIGSRIMSDVDSWFKFVPSEGYRTTRSYKVALNRVSVSTFGIGGSIKDCVSLCRLILDLERHSPW